MSKFIVSVREIHIQPVEIEAENKEEAVMKVREGDGEYLNGGEFSEVLDPETWTVEPVEAARV